MFFDNIRVLVVSMRVIPPPENCLGFHFTTKMPCYFSVVLVEDTPLPVFKANKDGCCGVFSANLIAMLQDGDLPLRIDIALKEQGLQEAIHDVHIGRGHQKIAPTVFESITKCLRTAQAVFGVGIFLALQGTCPIQRRLPRFLGVVLPVQPIVR